MMLCALRGAVSASVIVALAFIAPRSTDAMSLRDGHKGEPVKELMSWYHSGDEIHDEISDLVASCDANGDRVAQMSVAGTGPGGANLDVVRIKKKDSASGTKAVLVFGEHARELISPESALNFVGALCGHGSSAEFAKETLDKGVEFVIVPNANPKGRKQVEDGDYCKRTNQNGVDLNRNWGDEHRNAKRENPGDEMNPGPMGFSEPETQALRDLVDAEKPEIYLSVHSGAYLLGSAFGYKHGEPTNEAAINEILQPISEKYCDGGCPYGGLADMIGYKSEGCDIDYVAEHSGVPYAFTWEIYAGPEIRENYISKAEAQSGGAQESDDAKQFFFANSLNFMQHTARHARQRSGRSLRGQSSIEARLGHSEDEEEPGNCIEQFLPKSSDETKSVIENWSAAYLDLASRVADKKKGGSQPSAGMKAPASDPKPALPSASVLSDGGMAIAPAETPMETAPQASADLPRGPGSVASAMNAESSGTHVLAPAHAMAEWEYEKESSPTDSPSDNTWSTSDAKTAREVPTTMAPFSEVAAPTPVDMQASAINPADSGADVQAMQKMLSGGV